MIFGFDERQIGNGGVRDNGFPQRLAVGVDRFGINKLMQATESDIRLESSSGGGSQESRESAPFVPAGVEIPGFDSGGAVPTDVEHRSDLALCRYRAKRFHRRSVGRVGFEVEFVRAVGHVSGSAEVGFHDDITFRSEFGEVRVSGPVSENILVGHHLEVPTTVRGSVVRAIVGVENSRGPGFGVQGDDITARIRP